MQKPLHQLTREDIEFFTTLMIQVSHTDTNPTAKVIYYSAVCTQQRATSETLG
jgi:hypothetical protein